MTKYYEQFIGKTKGIFTLLEIKDNNVGIFKCSVCNKIHEVDVGRWKRDGRKKCGRKNTNHRLYDRYNKMIKRCYNPKNSRFKYYGARGIRVCDRWLESFNNFLEDMESSFQEGLELDRIDNDKGYSKDNCRWVTHSENMLNRRGFKNETNYPGVRKTNYNTFMGRCQINKKNYNTKCYDTPEEAYKALQELKLTLISEME